MKKKQYCEEIVANVMHCIGEGKTKAYVMDLFGLTRYQLNGIISQHKSSEKCEHLMTIKGEKHTFRIWGYPSMLNLD